MIQLALLLLVPLVFGQDPVDPIVAFQQHLGGELERLWVDHDFNKNGIYDIHDAHQFIRDYDTNGDGELTLTEFEYHWRQEEPTMIIIGDALFQEYDNDLSGHVNSDDIDILYARMDINHNGNIEKPEFQEYYRQLLTLLFILETQHINEQ